MSLDWPALQLLVDAGNTAGVARALRDLDERQRRRLAAPLTAYERGRRRFLRDERPALCVAAAGCLPDAEALARWPGFRLPIQASTPPLIVDVLRARRVRWLPELAVRLSGRLRLHVIHEDLWRLVAQLVAETGIEAPVTDGFLFGWIRDRYRQAEPGRGRGRGRPGGWSSPRLAEVLRADPLLDTVVAALFDSRAVGVPFHAALAALAAEGRLDRSMLLDACLERLHRADERPSEVPQTLRMHDALGPSLDEAAARVTRYLALLADAPATVAGVAQRELRRLDRAGRLDLDTVLDASRAALLRTERRLVATQLAWLDTVARRERHRILDVLRVATIALGTGAGDDLHRRALSLVVRHAPSLDVAVRGEGLAAALGLPSDLRAPLVDALCAPVPPGRSPGRDAAGAPATGRRGRRRPPAVSAAPAHAARPQPGFGP